MSERNVRLTSAEIAGLWETYMIESMSTCIMSHLNQHLSDEKIKPIIVQALSLSELRIHEIKKIFNKEDFPIPDRFSESDVNLLAPPLFHEEFSLSYVYSMSRMAMINYAFTTSSVTRLDLREFFTQCLHTTSDLYNDSTTLMLQKGIYDRPPMINYPNKVEYIDKSSFISGYLSKNRPLNSIELCEIFLNIERNYFGVILCIGLLQVITDKEIKEFIQNGKEICEKQIKFFNDILVKENLLGTIPTTMLVTNSTISPFSDRLIVLLFHALNQADITLIGHALGLSMRADLTAFYSKIIVDILKYGKDGFDIIVKRKWMEQPPQSK